MVLDTEKKDLVSTLANLERIRSSRISPLLLRVNKKASLDTSSEVLRLPRTPANRIHVITNICLVCIGTGVPQVFLGIMHSETKYYLYSSTISTAENSISWAGQAILLEWDQIFAELQGATAADEAVLTANGYAMRL